MPQIRNQLYKTNDPYANFPIQDYPLDLQGWDSENSIFSEVIREYKPKLIIEVGTWKGVSAIHMAGICKEYTNDFEIVCIDTFYGSYEMWVGIVQFLTLRQGKPDIYEKFIANVIHKGYTDNITPFPIDTHNGFLALKYLGVQADMIYIDAGHDYFSVITDLQDSQQILKPGGIILGDDYSYNDVHRAAHDVLGNVVDKGSKFLWKK